MDFERKETVVSIHLICRALRKLTHLVIEIRHWAFLSKGRRRTGVHKAISPFRRQDPAADERLTRGFAIFQTYGSAVAGPPLFAGWQVRDGDGRCFKHHEKHYFDAQRPGTRADGGQEYTGAHGAGGSL